MKLNKIQKYNLMQELAYANSLDRYYRLSPCCESWVKVELIGEKTYQFMNAEGKGKFTRIPKMFLDIRK